MLLNGTVIRQRNFYIDERIRAMALRRPGEGIHAY